MRLAKNAYCALSDIHGWGLFAMKTFRPGDTIDETPLAVFFREEMLHAPDQMIEQRLYALDDETWGLPLGDGALVNSSEEPNAGWTLTRMPALDTVLVRLHARTTIQRDDEITIAFANG